MRKRLVLLALLSSAAFVGLVNAQPGKKAPASKEEDRSRAAAKVESDKTDKPAEPAATTPSDDLGAAPPKDVAEQKPETKPSPLTPKPEEFPSGAAKRVQELFTTIDMCLVSPGRTLAHHQKIAATTQRNAQPFRCARRMTSRTWAGFSARAQVSARMPWL